MSDNQMRAIHERLGRDLAALLDEPIEQARAKLDAFLGAERIPAAPTLDAHRELWTTLRDTTTMLGLVRDQRLDLLAALRGLLDFLRHMHANQHDDAPSVIAARAAVARAEGRA